MWNEKACQFTSDRHMAHLTSSSTSPEDSRRAISHIDRLAEEVQIEIFRLCFYGEQDVDIRSNRQQQIQVIISHVCRRWRQISIDYPVFWNHLFFSSQVPASFKRLRTFLSRAKDTPLRIDLTFSTANTTNVSVDCPLPDQIIKFLVPSAPRWRSFRSQAHADVTDTILRCLTDARPMASLEDLHLLNLTGESHVQFPFNVFGAPSLRTCSFIDVPSPFLSSGSQTPTFPSLTRVHIQSRSLDQVLFLERDAFIRTLSQCPLLECLTIRCAHLFHVGNPNTTHNGDLVHMNNLTELVLEGLEPVTVGCLIKSLRLPHLHTLDVRFLPTDPQIHFSGCNAISHVLTANSSILDTVRCLRLAQFACGWEYMDEIFSHLDNVEDLLFECRVTAPSWLFRLLVPRDQPLSALMSDVGNLEGRQALVRDVVGPMLSSSIDTFRSRPVYLPRLKTLHLSGTHGTMLYQMIQCRIALSSPIPHVWLGDNDPIEEVDRINVSKACQSAGGSFRRYLPLVSPYAAQSAELST